MNILWDFDGTLFDTYPAYSRIVARVLGGERDLQEIYDKLKVSYGHAIDYYGITEAQQAKINELKRRLPPEETPPFAGVEEILKSADKNVIMTHKRRDGVKKIFAYYGWDKYFADMVTIDDGFPRKPDPASYKHLHSNHRIDLAIGDRELDLLPAKALGMTTCIFQSQSGAADYELHSYADFFDLPICGRGPY